MMRRTETAAKVKRRRAKAGMTKRTYLPLILGQCVFVRQEDAV